MLCSGKLVEGEMSLHDHPKLSSVVSRSSHKKPKRKINQGCEMPAASGRLTRAESWVCSSMMTMGNYFMNSWTKMAILRIGEAAAWLGGRPTGTPSHPTATIVMDDIVDQDTDAIVNAADWTMLGGTGVDGAIHEAAGPGLGRHIARSKARLEVAKALSTPGFNLKARHIIHACAPVYDSSEERDLFKALVICHRSCIQEAERLGLATMSVPLLGSGAFWWPEKLAAKAFGEAFKIERPRCRSLVEVRMVAFSDRAASTLAAELGVAPVKMKSQASLRYHPGKSALEGLGVDDIKKY